MVNKSTGILLLAGVSLAFAAGAGDEAAPRVVFQPTLRRPVAAVLLDQGRVLCVANRESGTLSVVDTTTFEVRGEARVARKLADLARLDARMLVAVDPEADEAVLLRWTDEGVERIGAIPVGRKPVRVAGDSEGKRMAIAALWSREVRVLTLSTSQDRSRGDKPRLIVERTVSLPFAPRELQWLPGGRRLLVAAAFGGEVAVVDAETGRVESLRETGAHNIRGVAFAADQSRLFLAHQVLNETTPTRRDDILSGRLIRNQITAFPLDALLEPRASLSVRQPALTLGVDNWPQGGADPAGIALDDRGRLVVAVAGVDQVVVYGTDGFRAQRLDVGRHPTAVVSGLPGGGAAVLNTFGDSLSILETEPAGVVREVSLGAMRPLEPAERGEELFFDARLSRRGWLSCHSCHTDGHTNERLADTLGDESYGTPKRVLSLLGVGQTDPWAWNGLAKELHGQVEKSVLATMHGESITGGEQNDIVAYLHTLAAPPPVAPPGDDADRAAIERGRQVFAAQKCVECHIPPLTYTSHGAYDVGLSDEAGLKKFNPPPLRGVGQRSRLFHDGRATSLEAVFAEHGHPLEEALSAEELRDLVRFLRSL